MKNCLIAQNANKKIINRLEELGYNVFLSKEMKNLDIGVRYHSDLQVHKLPNGKLITSVDSYEYYKELLKDTGVELIRGGLEVFSPYPNDISYNVKAFNGFVLGSVKNMDNVLKEKYIELNYGLVDSKQGYANCTILSDGLNWAISSDNLACKELSNRGCDVLEIERGGILLPYYKYGFIGGASGFFENTVYFTGNIDSLNCKDMIISFLKKFNVKIEFLSDDPIIDIGGILFF